MALNEEFLSKMVTALKSDELKQLKLPDLKTKIYGPAVIVIPIAIYA